MIPVVLLLEQANGDLVAVRFPSREDALDWEDAHPEILARGCVDLVGRREALAGAAL